MSLTLSDIKKLHDKAYQSGQITRECAADDMVFYYLTHWDDALLSDSQLSYRGQFDMLKKAGRHIMADLAENPVQNDFKPVDEEREDAAELADGLYRSDDVVNTSIEAYEVGKQEGVVCGVGAWQLHTEYVTLRSGDSRQVIRRKPVYEACNTVMWDPGARLLDKSDAKYVSVLSAYSEDGYTDLVEKLTGERPVGGGASFKMPEHSYTFPWFGGQGKKIYVTEFYHLKLSTERILSMEDPFGQVTELRELELAGAMDDMIDAGFNIVAEKSVERNVITKYIASGAEILSESRIAGTHLPVVPIYGEHAIVEGEEHYEGVTRLAKDPQRLRNFTLSYLADIVARSPRSKPVYFPEQIRGFEDMYRDSGAENNYPYLLQNRFAPDGRELPLGAVQTTPDQPMPSALPALLQLASDAVEDVANPGVPQDVADPDVSGKAVLALQTRLDMQSMVYQQHFKHAKRRDAQIYAAMAAEVYDTPRKATITLPDGTRKTVDMMQATVDAETGDTVFLNDIRSVEFEVISRIGPDYGTQRQQTVDRIIQMIPLFAEGDPMRKALQLKALQHQDGVDLDDIRKYARKQLILTGIQEPDTPEEEQLLVDAQQQGEQPGADMVLAMAEDKKGQAALMKEQREAMALQAKQQIEAGKLQVSGFGEQTKRLSVQIDAQEAGASIDNKNVDTLGKKLDNATRIQQLTDDDLMKLAGA